MATKQLSVNDRRAIFFDLVTTQDELPDVAESRRRVAEKFEIIESQLRDIEDEGIDQQWPPLEEEEILQR
jgi:hypothetical protein